MLQPIANLAGHYAWFGTAQEGDHLESRKWITSPHLDWRDPWLPREHSRRVTSKQGRWRLKWGSDLLAPDGHDWDFDKLRSLFNVADVEAIEKIIKLPQRPSEDVLAWHMEKSGLFTVRSAYNLALKLEHLESRQASPAAPEGDRKLWKLIWSGNVAPKVNAFAWKLARDILPTRRAKFQETGGG